MKKLLAVVMAIARTIVLAVVLALVGTSVFAADCNTGVRYKDNGNGTVTDCKTGLVWLKDANCRDTSGGIRPGKDGLNWDDAMRWAAGLHNGLCGLTDGSSAGAWRLPTKAEWEAMIADANSKGYKDPSLTNAAGTAQWTNGDIFYNVLLSGYDYKYHGNRFWSSTTFAGSAIHAWFVGIDGVGGVGANPKEFNHFVWPVRGGR